MEYFISYSLPAARGQKAVLNGAPTKMCLEYFCESPWYWLELIKSNLIVRINVSIYGLDSVLSHCRTSDQIVNFCGGLVCYWK